MILALLFAAWAQDVPTIEDLDRGLTRIGRLLEHAETAEASLADAEVSWIRSRCLYEPCKVQVGVDIVVQARVAGNDLRDLVQSARAELQRMERVAASVTVRPLLGTERVERLDVTRDAIGTATRAYLARSAWYERYMAPWAWHMRSAVDRACARAPIEEDAPP